MSASQNVSIVLDTGHWTAVGESSAFSRLDPDPELENRKKSDPTQRLWLPRGSLQKRDFWHKVIYASHVYECLFLLVKDPDLQVGNITGSRSSKRGDPDTLHRRGFKVWVV